MSVKVVSEQIQKFLSRADAEVLCIRGKWGVGKTYSWAKQLEASQKAGKVALARYSYVPLFGVNSLPELKLAIFENVITLKDGVRTASLETLDNYVNQIVGWRRFTRLSTLLPGRGADIAAQMSFLSIRGQIVCIDDLERAGKNLDVSDVLGLISYLREQRNCKVVLILNDKMLDGDQKRDFEKHLEKVVDISLAFEPSASDSVKIGITGTDQASLHAAERCVALGVTNIRVIKRIRRFVAELEPLLKELDPDVFKSAVASIVLFCWSHDQPEEAPSIEFLRKKTQATFGLGKDNQMTPEEAKWSAITAAYGYYWTDELDLALIDGVLKGYFDPERIAPPAKNVHDANVAAKADGSFEEAWRAYHDSFENDQDAVLDGLFASFMKNFKYISPMNLSGIVVLFKELGRPEQAAEMLKHYVDNRDEGREFFDLEEQPFGDEVKDPDVRAAFREKAVLVEEIRDFAALFATIKDGWRADTVKALASVPVEEYRAFFKANSGADLRKILGRVFEIERVSNVTDEMKEILRRVKEALRLIGGESAINARRVRRFGVIIEDQAREGPNDRR